MNNIIMTIVKLDVGQSHTFADPLNVVTDAINSVGAGHLYTVSSSGQGTTVLRSKPSKRSSWLYEALSAFDGTDIELQGDIASKRSSVSRYNKMHGTKFVVRKRTGSSTDQAYVTCAFEDRKAYTLEELDAWYQPQANKLTKAQNDLIDKYNELYERVTDKPAEEEPEEEEVYQRIPPVLDEEDEDELM